VFGGVWFVSSVECLREGTSAIGDCDTKDQASLQRRLC